MNDHVKFQALNLSAYEMDRSVCNRELALECGHGAEVYDLREVVRQEITGQGFLRGVGVDHQPVVFIQRSRLRLMIHGFKGQVIEELGEGSQQRKVMLWEKFEGMS